MRIVQNKEGTIVLLTERYEYNLSNLVETLDRYKSLQSFELDFTRLIAAIISEVEFEYPTILTDYLKIVTDNYMLFWEFVNENKKRIV